MATMNNPIYLHIIEGHLLSHTGYYLVIQLFKGQINVVAGSKFEDLG